MPTAFFRAAGEAQRNIALRFAKLGDILLLWLARYRERRKLQTLSDHMLRDMGVSRADADREAMKRFWRG